MKSMKRILSAMLALLVVLSMGVFATSATESENQVIYFKAPTGEGLLDWSHPDTRVYCHIWVYGGDTYNSFDSLARWGSKQERCSKTDTDGVWMYDITSKGLKLEEGVTYLVFFYETIFNMQTYDTLFDTTCLGDTLYCKTEDYIIENPLDSYKQTIAAYWKNADPEKYGPVRQLTSIGNVVGECYAPNEDAESLYVDFIKNDLKAAVTYSGMTEAEVLKHSAAQLKISEERAFELELEAGLHTPFTKDELPLPSTSATEVVTDAPETEVPTTETTTDAPETETSATEVTTDAPETEIPTTEDTTANIPSTDDNTEEVPDTGNTETDKEEQDTNRYYFYYPTLWNTSADTTAGIYWWDGENPPDVWPGVEANKADAEGVYYYDVPKDVTTIIWNNFIDGGMDPETEVYKLACQTKNIGCEYYDADESYTYPDGVKSFDGMIFVVDKMISVSDFSAKRSYEGEWYYYYGNGEYGVTPEKGDRVYTDSYLEEPLAPATDSKFALGDVNMDGKLNIKDATSIQKYAAKMIDFDEVQKTLADYNLDQKINVKDATRIQKKLANLI